MDLLYLYGVVREARRPPAAPEPRLQILSHCGLSALFEPVGGEEFSPRALDDKLESLEWVAAQARTHHAVLDRVIRKQAVVPARLCTMFSSRSALRAQLGEQRHQLHALLDAIEGREEWSIKVFCHRTTLEREIAAREGLHGPASGLDAPGRAFLHEKRRHAELTQLVYDAIDDCLDEVLERVEDLTFATRQRSLLSEQTTGRTDAMMLNVAALLDHGADEALARALDEVAEYHGEHFCIELSGPWPAYSFCNVLDEPAASGQWGIDVEPR